MSQIMLFTLLCLALLSTSVAREPKFHPPPPVSTFVLQPNVQESIAVGLVTSDGITLDCKLDYDTSTVSDAKKVYEPVNQLLKKMNTKYGCLPYTAGIFQYEICLGDRIDQVADNGDRYSLGKFIAFEDGFKSVQLYKDGTFCEAAHAARKSVVEFSCSDKARVMSIDEHATCQYRVLVGVPEVCGHPGFSSVSKLESWLLEIFETDTGEIICQAYNNGFDVVGTASFSQFSLALSNPSFALTKHTVRRKNRRVADEDNLIIDVSPARVQTQERMQIDYAKIVAE